MDMEDEGTDEFPSELQGKYANNLMATPGEDTPNGMLVFYECELLCP